MTRIAAETRSCTTAQWISDHVGPQRKYKPPPPGEGPQTEAPSPDTKVGCQPFLPADVRACRSRPIPKGQDRQNGRRQVLVVRKWEATIPPLSLYRMPGVDAPDQNFVEGYREGVRVAISKGPLGQVALEGKFYGSGVGFPWGQQCWMH